MNALVPEVNIGRRLHDEEMGPACTDTIRLFHVRSFESYLPKQRLRRELEKRNEINNFRNDQASESNSHANKKKSLNESQTY